jgi:hypothetical protein
MGGAFTAMSAAKADPVNAVAATKASKVFFMIPPPKWAKPTKVIWANHYSNRAQRL